MDDTFPVDSHAPRRLRRRKDLRASTADNAAWAAHVGCGETYLSPFMLLVGGGQVAAGLVAALPQVAGAVMQLFSPLAVKRIGSLKRWVVLCAALQGLSFIPLVIAALIGHVPAWALFLMAAFYWGSGTAAGPAWSTWMGTVVPPRIRARYFAFRTRVGNVTQLISLLAAGAALQYGEQFGVTASAFALIFIAAGSLRLLSAFFLSRVTESVPLPPGFRQVSPLELGRRLRGGNDMRLLVYMLAVSFGSWTAAPFFGPYMLETLNFSYVGFVIQIATLHASRIIFMPLLGLIAHRMGADRLLWIGGVAITPAAALWAITTDYTLLIMLQTLSGFAWAAYELGALLMTFETVRESERTSILTLFNFCNALAIAIGSIAGGAFLAALGKTEHAFHAIFVISSILRVVSLLLLFRVAVAPFRGRPSGESTPMHVSPTDPAIYDSVILTVREVEQLKQDGKKP